jgi:uncharacterized protein
MQPIASGATMKRQVLSRHKRATRQSTKYAVCLVLLALTALLFFEGRAMAIAGIHAYRQTLSPLAERLGVECRFSPTCSRYAEAVIARDGLARGGWKALKRIVWVI